MEQSGRITGPECRTPTEDTMLTTACVYFWNCPAWSEHLRSRTDDCSVFCSYGDRPCSPHQAQS
jgi:hypothetical protein